MNPHVAILHEETKPDSGVVLGRTTRGRLKILQADEIFLMSREALENLVRWHNDLLAKTRGWESQLSQVMPPDFKDWWENDPNEWPLVARKVIENLREREALAWELLEKEIRDTESKGTGEPEP